ncbi:hypothetical protein DERF_005332 [Dermatophagoides farinae]|uniref:Uncharacterized protein n=1 Tax=Dermatophagoides farinae TaxID=6954 RepID=A0A922I802_DERFA|nr:hypothetical protein DERF_005332 [Dermatophagoides farinae]
MDNTQNKTNKKEIGKQNSNDNELVGNYIYLFIYFSLASSSSPSCDHITSSSKDATMHFFFWPPSLPQFMPTILYSLHRFRYVFRSDSKIGLNNVTVNV